MLMKVSVTRFTCFFFFFSSRRRHTRYWRDWSSDVCSSDLVDVLSLGATKSGALSAEAIVTFDDRVADQLVFRTKRSGHVTSKMRFQSAQLAAYLTEGLWLRLARNANQRMAELAAELESLALYGVRFQERVDVNMAFVDLPAPAIDVVAGAGVLFYRMSPTSVRLVTSWQTTADDVIEAGTRFREAVLGRTR